MNGRRVIALLLLGAQSACLGSPKRVDYAPRQYLALNSPKELWLTLKDGKEVTVVAPRVIADTVFGWNPKGNEDLTVALSDVKELRARQLSVVKTALIPTAIVAGAVGIYLGTRGNVQRGGDTMSVCVGNSCLGN